jgi:LPS-assembly protein
MVQTLEPRIYYVYIPFRDQSGIPNFDSGLQDINFATIYSENQFAGSDRINDANQLTVGVTTRFVNAATGSEVLRAGVAQRFYFDTQQVSLPGTPVRTSSSSDLLAAMSGTIWRNWFADAGRAVQHRFFPAAEIQRRHPLPAGPGQGDKRKLSRNAQPDPANRSLVPVAGARRLDGAGPVELLAHRQDSVETLAGIEYNGGCWELRVVAHSFVTAARQTNTTFFVPARIERSLPGGL